MVMLPATVTQQLGQSTEISFLLFFLSRSAPLLKRLTRRLNQPKKRPWRARIGRYLGFIEAYWRNAPVFFDTQHEEPCDLHPARDGGVHRIKIAESADFRRRKNTL